MNIKSALKIVPSILFLICADAGQCADQPSVVKISIDFRQKEGSKTPYKLIAPDDNTYGSFFVVIENISSKPISLIEFDKFSVTLEVADENGKTSIVGAYVGQASALSPPRTIGLKPKETTEIEIPYAPEPTQGLDGKYHIPFPPPRESCVVTICAVFQSAFAGSKESAKMLKKGYWFGKAKSEPYKVTLVGSN